MSLSTKRVALLRRQRKEQGMKQSTIWLTPEDEKIITGMIKRNGLRGRTEVIRYALKQAFNKETEMQT